MPLSLRSAASVKEFYELAAATPTAITDHLPTLRYYAGRCSVAGEFGVKRGASSSALLMGASVVYSWDIKETAEARHLETLAGQRWHYAIGDSRSIPKEHFPPMELLFIDSLHTYAQVRAELNRAMDHVSKYLIFHDTVTFGSVGAQEETGQQQWNYSEHHGQSVPMEHLGIMPAILEFMSQRPQWRVLQHDANSHGLLILRNEA